MLKPKNIERVDSIVAMILLLKFKKNPIWTNVRIIHFFFLIHFRRIEKCYGGEKGFTSLLLDGKVITCSTKESKKINFNSERIREIVCYSISNM